MTGELFASAKDYFRDDVMRMAIRKGDLPAVKYFYLNDLLCPGNIMDLVSQYGHWDIFEYLLTHDEKPSTKALNTASAQGQLETVKYLLSKNAECTTDAMDSALRCGHTEIFKCIKAAGKKYTQQALKDAIKTRGITYVSEFILEVTTAVENDNVEIVEILCDVDASIVKNIVDEAVSTRSLKVGKYLYSKYPELVEQSVKNAIKNASYGELEIVKHLRGVSTSSYRPTRAKHPEMISDIVKYFCEISNGNIFSVLRLKD